MRRGGACSGGNEGKGDGEQGRKTSSGGRITPSPAQRSRRSLLSCSPNLESRPFPTHLPRKQRRSGDGVGGSCQLPVSSPLGRAPKARRLCKAPPALGPGHSWRFFAMKAGVRGGPAGSSGAVVSHTPGSSPSGSPGAPAFLLSTNIN